MGSVRDDFPHCLCVKDGKTEWSPLQHQQKLAYEQALTMVQKRNTGGISCSTSENQTTGIEIIETNVSWKNVDYNYTFIIDNWGSAFQHRDEQLFDGQMYIKLRDGLFHSVTTDIRPIPTIETFKTLSQRYAKK